MLTQRCIYRHHDGEHLALGHGMCKLVLEEEQLYKFLPANKADHLCVNHGNHVQIFIKSRQ